MYKIYSESKSIKYVTNVLFVLWFLFFWQTFSVILFSPFWSISDLNLLERSTYFKRFDMGVKCLHNTCIYLANISYDHPCAIHYWELVLCIPVWIWVSSFRFYLLKMKGSHELFSSVHKFLQQECIHASSK